MKEETKRKIIEWVENPYNQALLGIILFTIGLRLYYFFITKDQPLWYDEADYMNIARSWLGEYTWNTSPTRPLLFSGLIYVVMSIGLGETAMRILSILFSVMAVYLTYEVGALLFDKKTGLIAAFMLSIFWSFLFYTNRILVDVPLTTLWLASIWTILYAYLKNKSWRWYVSAGVLLGLSFLLKYSTIALIGIIGIYLLTTERFNLIRNNKLYIYALSALATVSPFLIYEQIKYGDPLAFLRGAVGDQASAPRTFFQSLYDQTVFSVALLHWILIACFLAGLLAVIYKLALSYNYSLTKGSLSNKYYFSGLWLIISLLFFGKLNYGSYMDERYYFVFYPIIFIFAAEALISGYNLLKRHYKGIAIVGIILILSFAAYQNINHADGIIKSKVDSFKPLKEGGLYINQHTNKGEIFLSIEEDAEMLYYSQRDTMRPANITDLMNKIKTNNPRYIFLSFYYSLNNGDGEKLAMIDFILSNPQIFKPVKAYTPYIDEQNKIPIAILLEVNRVALSNFGNLSGSN